MYLQHCNSLHIGADGGATRTTFFLIKCPLSMGFFYEPSILVRVLLLAYSVHNGLKSILAKHGRILVKRNFTLA